MATYDRKDHYYRRARLEGFRSRAAYKLAEIQRSRHLLRRGQKVVDLGCWPGGWLQVASREVGPKGCVVGVDLAPIEPPIENENVIALCGDLSEPAVAERILDALGGRADVVLADAAPKLTGVRATDRAREEALLEAIEGLVPRLLRPGGGLLVKILEGPEAQVVETRLRAPFAESKRVRPDASRRGSAEHYLWALGYAGSAGP